MRYDWPGNVRELENIVERALIGALAVSPSGAIAFGDINFPDELTSVQGSNGEQNIIALDEINRNHIQNILAQCKDKVKGRNGAALLLGINPDTL